MSDISHELVALLKECVRALGKTPTEQEFVSLYPSSKPLITLIGGFSILLQQASIKPEKKKRFQYIPSKLKELKFTNTHDLSLEALFSIHNNPEFLKLAAMPDTHVEHADPWALNCFLEYIYITQPDVLIIMGDFLNAGGLSHWGNDGLDPMRIMPEVLKGRELLTIIRSLIPNATIIYLEGNHEDWIKQFIRSNNNPQLFDGIDKIGMEITLEKLLDLATHRIKLFPMNLILRIGKAGFSHGMFVGDNHAKQHLVKVKNSFFYGHTHDSKAFSDTSINGPVIAQSLCCLCDKNPKFLRGLLNNWEHGFGEFKFFRDGSFIHTVPKILNGKTVIDGHVFKA